MSKIDEIRKRHEELTRKLARLGRHAGLIESAQAAHDDRGELLALLDSGAWQDEKPGPGDWWLSLHPEKRIGLFDDKRPLRIVIDAGGDVIEEPSRTRLFTSQLTGALWQRRTVPRDPFKGGE